MLNDFGVDCSKIDCKDCPAYTEIAGLYEEEEENVELHDADGRNILSGI